MRSTWVERKLLYAALRRLALLLPFTAFFVYAAILTFHKDKKEIWGDFMMISALGIGIAETVRYKKSARMKRIRNYGNLEELSPKLEAIFRSPETVHLGTMHYGGGHIIMSSMLRFDAFPVDCLMVAVRLPSNKPKAKMLLRFVTGERASFVADKALLDTLQEEFGQANPYMIKGSTEDLEKLYGVKDEMFKQIEKEMIASFQKTGVWAPVKFGTKEECAAREQAQAAEAITPRDSSAPHA